LRYV
jgi:hypothetical protein